MEQEQAELPQPHTYALLDKCVENGIAAGHRRAHKHTDTPRTEHLHECIRQAIMDEMVEYFDFDS